MDVISLARQLGKAIQQDESYIKMMHCAQVNDEDQELQDLIGQFNLKRVDLNNEINKSDKDQSRIDALNEEVRELYGKLMTNTSMTATMGMIPIQSSIILDAAEAVLLVLDAIKHGSSTGKIVAYDAAILGGKKTA